VSLHDAFEIRAQEARKFFESIMQHFTHLPLHSDKATASLNLYATLLEKHIQSLDIDAERKENAILNIQGVSTLLLSDETRFMKRMGVDVVFPKARTFYRYLTGDRQMTQPKFIRFIRPLFLSLPPEDLQMVDQAFDKYLVAVVGLPRNTKKWKEES